MVERISTQHPPRKSRIPNFATIKEESEFWDTNDITEFEDETIPVTLDVRDPLESLIAVQLDADDRETLNEIAKKAGVTPEKLVREWVIERLGKRS